MFAFLMIRRARSWFSALKAARDLLVRKQAAISDAHQALEHRDAEKARRVLAAELPERTCDQRSVSGDDLPSLAPRS